MTPGSRAQVWDGIDFSRVHSLLGPLHVRGARPGDALEVEILDVEHHGWGWTGGFPGDGGLLANDFAYPNLQHWLVAAGVAWFRDGDTVADAVEVPAAPFCGVMGVAPAEAGRFGTLPPRANGGNVDIRHLTAGATVLVPILAEGDGEVCCTAIEAPLTMRFDAVQDIPVRELRFDTPNPLTPADPLSNDQAYCLSSVAGDLRVSQAVMSNRVVAFALPRSVLTTS